MIGVIAEIRGFAGNFAPRAWAMCQGQLMAISSNTALFSLIGTTYGGDGRTTFKLPDLRGRVPVGTGTGPGLPTVALGATGGNEWTQLTVNQMPQHSHLVINNLSPVPSLKGELAMKCNPGTGNQDTPKNGYPAEQNDGTAAYAPKASATSEMGPSATVPVNGSIQMTGSITVGHTGQSQSYSNVQPFLSCNFIICMQGVYPSRS